MLDVFKELNNNTLSVNSLVDKYEVTTYKNIQTVFIKNTPICIGNGQFFGDIVFKDNKFYSMHLQPSISDYAAPKYPTKEYQMVKYNFCIKCLEEVLCCKSSKNSEGGLQWEQWETDFYTAMTYIVTAGRDAFEGGNIVVNAR